VSFNKFGLAKPEQNHRLLDIADTERLVVMVEHEHFSTQFDIGSNGGCFEAEDSQISFRYIRSLSKFFLEACSGSSLKI
jgi:hypothetical protein